MVGAHQKLTGSRDLTTPLSGMVCHPWVSNLPATFEDSMSSHYKDMKDDINVENGVVWGSWGHSRSPEIAPVNRAHTSSY